MNFLTLLRRSSAEERVALIQHRYEKNIEFFKERHPELIQFLNATPASYHLNLTETFFDLVHTETNRICNIEQGLDKEAEARGQYNDSGWMDLHNIQLTSDPAYPLHDVPLTRIRAMLAEEFSECHEQIISCSLPVQYEKNNKRFSSPCVFLGIFHGLHIDYYLDTNEVPALLLIEPEPKRFEISLFFLDYREIENRFGVLYLAIGSNMGSSTIRNFFSLNRVHIRMWCRVCLYESNENSLFFVDTMKRYQRARSSLFFPFDVEYKGLENGTKNIANGLPILSRRPKLSKGSVVAVVASGPSLDRNIDWLVKNRRRIILFAVHSAVRVLRTYDLKPDFQFNLDAERPLEVVEKLQLNREIPLISDHKVGKNFINAVDSVLLCAEKHKSAMVEFEYMLEETHPSTTNLAFSFACFCRPHTIVLLGCDLGYESRSQMHAKHTMQESGREASPASSELGVDEGRTIANFPEDSTVITNSFLTSTRVCIENCAEYFGKRSQIYNFSHGARIGGVKAQHAKHFRFFGKKNKRKTDVQAIRNCFSPAKKGNNYKSFATPAVTLTKRLREELTLQMNMQHFSRVEFSRRIDSVIDKATKACVTTEKDYRMTVYSNLLTDILSVWNCYMLSSRSVLEAEQIWQKGREIVQAVFDEVQGIEILEKILEGH